MEPMTLSEIAQAVGGTLNPPADGNIAITSICKDTRDKLSGGLYVAIRGEKYDGHDFIAEAMAQGARAVLSEKQTQYPAVLVSDTRGALMALAEYYRGKFSIPVIGVTGSAGKTTTKDLIASVLSQKYKVSKTAGNLNNEIGLPLTIFSLDKTCEAAVWELGISEPGEMERLSRMARPTIGVITNIGTSHIGKLNGQDGILAEKKQIFNYLQPGGAAVLNGDDGRLNHLNLPIENVFYYGIQNHRCQYRAENIRNDGISGVRFTLQGENLYAGTEICLSAPGTHMILNALAAAAVAGLLGLTKEQVKTGLESFAAPPMRMKIHHSGHLTVIDDAYNANPASVKAALDVLAAAEGRKTAVLGDMLELGAYSEELHREVGEYAAKLGLDLLLFAGPESRYAYEAAKESGGKAFYLTDKAALLAALPEFMAVGGTVLVKASRGMGFETVVEKLIIH